MRLSVLLAAGALALPTFAQSTVTTYTPDLANGGYLVSSASATSDHTQTQIAQSLNGTQVPLEQHTDRVISSDANGSMTESVVRHYDPTGQFAGTERTVTELHKNPDGSSTVRSTSYRSDVNGGEQIAERRTTETQVSGKTTTVTTAIDQPGLNGSFQTIEKRVDVTQDLTQGTDKKSTTTASVYRRSGGEDFREAVRKVINQTVSDGRTVEDTTDYELGTTAGSLQFQDRRVSTTTSAPGGGQSTIVDVYAPSVDGVVRGTDETPQLKQQQIITRAPSRDGSVVDTFSVREPNLSDPGRLGEVRQITKTVCTGNCAGSPSAPPPAPAPAKP